MSLSTTEPPSTTGHRPTEVLAPPDELARRAERALFEQRIEDAARHLEAMPGKPLVTQYWKTLLQAAVCAARNRLIEAEARAWQALGLASAIAQVPAGVEEITVKRMTAKALSTLGILLRRQERVREAFDLHDAARTLRVHYGSIDEEWESLVELALDADLLGDAAGAIARFQEAATLARGACVDPMAKQARAWELLSRVYAAANRHEEAIEAARTSRRLWVEHDPGAVTAARADLRLGSALVAGAMARKESEQERRVQALEEAVTVLTAAEESLAAFGADYDAESRWAREQRDFARRLRKDLDSQDV